MTSKKQEVHQIRGWTNFGSLTGIASRLSNIAHDKYTLPRERNSLLDAETIVREVLAQWKQNTKQLMEGG